MQRPRETDSSSTKTRERGGSCRGWETTSCCSLPRATVRVMLVASLEGWSPISSLQEEACRPQSQRTEQADSDLVFLFGSSEGRAKHKTQSIKRSESARRIKSEESILRVQECAPQKVPGPGPGSGLGSGLWEEERQRVDDKKDFLESKVRKGRAGLLVQRDHKGWGTAGFQPGGESGAERGL